MLLNMQRKNGSFTLLALFTLLAFATQATFAERIAQVNGINDGQSVTGELRIETKVADLENGADYTVWYDIEGPTKFEYFDEDAPYVLNERRVRLGHPRCGARQLQAQRPTLSRTSASLDFRYINFTIGKQPQGLAYYRDQS